MARQTKKQKQAAESFGGKDCVTWKGQLCQIIGNEPVTQSNGDVILCAKLKVLGVPLHQGLRLVPLAEIEVVK
jgi:hypothetical protein